MGTIVENAVEEQERLKAALSAMVQRARNVVAVWEHGDLAGRIHDLEEFAEAITAQFVFLRNESGGEKNPA